MGWSDSGLLDSEECILMKCFIDQESFSFIDISLAQGLGYYSNIPLDQAA